MTNNEIDSLCLHAIFDSVVLRHPEQIALTVDDTQASYQQVKDYSEFVSRHLWQAGARRGDRIATLLPKALSSLPIIIGIMRLGCVYVPLECTYSAPLIQRVVKDTSAKFIFSSRQYADELDHQATATLFAEDLPSPDNIPPTVSFTTSAWHPPEPVLDEDLACIFSTVTSDKVLRRVLIAHREFAKARNDDIELDMQPGDRLLHCIPLGRGCSMYAIVAALFSGANLYWRDLQGLATGEAVYQFLNERDITHAILTHSMLASLPRRPLPSLRLVIVLDEPVAGSYLPHWSQHVTLFSCPSENQWGIRSLTDLTLMDT